MPTWFELLIWAFAAIGFTVMALVAVIVTFLAVIWILGAPARRASVDRTAQATTSLPHDNPLQPPPAAGP